MEVTYNSNSSIYNNYAAISKKSMENREAAKKEQQERVDNVKQYSEQKEVTKEETVAVYYNYQYNQAMKNSMEILMEGSTNQDEDELSPQDINEMQEQKNRNTVIDYYASNPYSNEGASVDIRV